MFKKLPSNCAEDENTPSAFNLVYTTSKCEEAVANSILSAFATIPLFADTTFIVLVAQLYHHQLNQVPAVTLYWKYGQCGHLHHNQDKPLKAICPEARYDKPFCPLG